MSLLRLVVKVASAVLLMVAGLVVTSVAPANAAAYVGEPTQANCDSSIPNFSWQSMGLTHATVASLHVNAGFGDETVPSPAVAAGNHKLAVSVCATEEEGNKTDLTVYQQLTSPTDTSFDLAGALTPAGHPITSSSVITVTLSDLGTRASAYTFSLVHGTVSNWTPTNLGTSSAALAFSFSPTRTPEIDTNTHPEWGSCSATPPSCPATSSAIDTLTASIDMDFGAGNFTAFSGAYFALTGAVAGFVKEQGSSINATLGGPHLLADGTTPNVGSMEAFLPDSVLASALHTTAADAAALTVTRTDGGGPTDAPFTATVVPGGAVITVSNITFSSPAYSISSGSGGSVGGPGTPGYVDGHGVKHDPVVGVDEGGNDDGYWLATKDGGVYAFGNVGFYGSMAGKSLAAPIVGNAASATGHGYYLVASDGGVFAFGDAKFVGSMGGRSLNSPIVSIVPTGSGDGYYEIAADGGVFAFGDARFLGSMGGQHLNSPIVSGDTAGNKGYYLVAADGGVFAYGDAPFTGSAANLKLNKPITNIFVVDNGAYILVGADGGLSSYGGAPLLGSLAGTKLASPIIGATLDGSDGGIYMAGSGGDVYRTEGVPDYGSLA